MEHIFLKYWANLNTQYNGAVRFDTEEANFYIFHKSVGEGFAEVSPIATPTAIEHMNCENMITLEQHISNFSEFQPNFKGISQNSQGISKEFQGISTEFQKILNEIQGISKKIQKENKSPKAKSSQKARMLERSAEQYFNAGDEFALVEIRDKLKGLHGAANNARTNKAAHAAKLKRREALKKYSVFVALAASFFGVLYYVGKPQALKFINEMEQATAVVSAPTPTHSRAQIESAVNAYASAKNIKVWQFRRNQVWKAYNEQPNKTLVLTIDSIINHKY